MLRKIQFLRDLVTGSHSSSDVCKFLFDSGKDNEGRTLEDYRSFTLEEMELNHDYIQWMFPLNEPSRFNPNAPILTKRDIKYGTQRLVAGGKRSDVILDNLHQYLKFLFSQEYILEKPFDHNHLRISRVIKCLRLFDLEFEANQTFFLCTFRNKDILSESCKHWEEALHKNLWSKQ